jgi:hypothetical protein
MRARLTALAAGLLLAAGCGTTVPEMKEATPEDEKAAEQRIREEAARELKARKQQWLEQKNGKVNPADAD